jgi:hypothetical protein
MLVAVVMLFVVGAMAALSIDVVTLYTARSEAQLAADGAALAGARVLANSGMTSDPNAASDGLMASAWNLAKAVAIQVATQNKVGGTNLTPAEVTPSGPGGTNTDPTVTVVVQKNDLPTFFARIWGTRTVTVKASATAEAYNPSGARALGGTNPVKTTCVKPWLLPNKDPSNSDNPIFATTTGAINPGSTLLGWSFTSPTGKQMSLNPACAGAGGCVLPQAAPPSWNYFPGDEATTFPHPTNSLPSCLPALTSNYQEAVAGCIEIAISCNSPANIDTNAYAGNRNSDTADAVNCLTHATNNQGDTVASPVPPVSPFQFIAGVDNPVAATAGKNVMVSDSLVTVPVFDSSGGAAATVQIIGFVQLFLNPDGLATLPSGNVNTTVVNLAGCGTGATGTPPILGNGASPVAVRLISPP